MKGIPKQNLLVGGLGYVDPGYIAKKILDCFREASFAGLKVLTPIKVGSLSQWLFLVPLKGGIGGIVHPPIGRKNTTYIPLIFLAFWGVKNATDPTFYGNHFNNH